MKNLSLKLDEQICEDLEEIRLHLSRPRNRYINEALAMYNDLQKRKLLAKRLEQDSYLVRDNSMSVLREYEGLEAEGLEGEN